MLYIKQLAKIQKDSTFSVMIFDIKYSLWTNYNQYKC